MNAEDFRRLALQQPGATENTHMRHPDFRVGKRIFATLGYPDEGCAMVRLTREQQETLMAAEPEIFAPVTGAWGKQGATLLRLGAADEATALSAVRMAWGNLQP